MASVDELDRDTLRARAIANKSEVENLPPQDQAVVAQAMSDLISTAPAKVEQLMVALYGEDQPASRQ
jgi:hypothetical protein